MHVQVSKWGNSLGLRLPKALVRQLGIDEGQKVSITAEGNKLIVEPIGSVYRLEGLLANMTPEAMGNAFDWGQDVGSERVDG